MSALMLVTNIRVVTKRHRLSRSERTRRRLQATALELFARDGYDETTVEDIANAAEVSHMTFFRHFPTKESVVVTDPFDPAIAQAVALQPARLPALKRVCRGFRAALADLESADEEMVRARVRLVADNPSLQGGMWAATTATQEAVAGELMDDHDEPEARVAAGAVVGALTVALLDWAATDKDDRNLGDALGTALDVLDPDGSAVDEEPR